MDETSKKLYADVTNDTITFIKTSYSEIGKEKRTISTSTKAKKAISIDTLKEGDILEGVVRNVVAF